MMAWPPVPAGAVLALRLKLRKVIMRSKCSRCRQCANCINGASPCQHVFGPGFPLWPRPAKPWSVVLKRGRSTAGDSFFTASALVCLEASVACVGFRYSKRRSTTSWAGGGRTRVYGNVFNVISQLLDLMNACPMIDPHHWHSSSERSLNRCIHPGFRVVGHVHRALRATDSRIKGRPPTSFEVITPASPTGNSNHNAHHDSPHLLPSRSAFCYLIRCR
jgi:hypothetical protein